MKQFRVGLLVRDGLGTWPCLPRAAAAARAPAPLNLPGRHAEDHRAQAGGDRPSSTRWRRSRSRWSIRSSATASWDFRSSRRRTTWSTCSRRTASRSRRTSIGIPTAFMATWGSGKPVIALGSDIDGIPQSSQKPGVAYHDPMIEGAPGHGEGHNSGMVVNITAAIVLKKMMEREKIPGTIRIWPGVAEELVGTKAYYVRAGLFKDVDVALFAHVDRSLVGVVGRSCRHRTGLGAVQLQGRERPRRRRAVARAQRARRGRADGRRLELSGASTCRSRSARTTSSPTAARSPTSSRRRPRSGTTSARPRIRASRTCGRSATRSRRAPR